MEEGRFSLEVTPVDAGKRLDKFLAEKLAGGYSRSLLQKYVDTGKILVNGERVSRHHPVAAGERVEITIPESSHVTMLPEDIPLNIVYEDADLLVVNKAGDMVVHPAPGNWTGTLVNALLAHCRDLSGVGGELKPGIVHRIDKGTTGLLVVAKNDRAHRSLSKQFKAKAATRLYVAVVRGIVQFDNGVIEGAIGRSRDDRRKMVVDPESPRDAITYYTVLERFGDATLVELKLGTGRTHQIRVHMAHIGHPLIGDETYGLKAPIGRPALHARTIGFTHPATGKYVEFASALPKDMERLIKDLRASKVKK